MTGYSLNWVLTFIHIEKEKTDTFCWFLTYIIKKLCDEAKAESEAESVAPLGYRLSIHSYFDNVVTKFMISGRADV